ncbi:MAG: outer membrane beta-barrel protein [Gemmatimonadaceae bacterium]|nr:outer membrane beta-barrel protein [Gemmatimonadaceae bacterium]
MSRMLKVFALLAVSGSALSAQTAAKRFAVTTRLGSLVAERAASLDPAAVIGLDAEYAVNKYFGLGTAVDVSRGNTTSKDFLTRLRFGNQAQAGGDSIYYQFLGQPVNTVNLGLIGTLRYPGSRVSPFVMGGVGTYVMILDAQVNGKETRTNDVSYTGGVGVWLKLNERAGLQLDLRSVTYNGYDRQFLNPARGRPELVNPLPEDFEQPPAAKKSAMNTMLTIGFRYIPGGVGGGN